MGRSVSYSPKIKQSHIYISIETNLYNMCLTYNFPHIFTEELIEPSPGEITWGVTFDPSVKKVKMDEDELLFMYIWKFPHMILYTVNVLIIDLK